MIMKAPRLFQDPMHPDSFAVAVTLSNGRLQARYYQMTDTGFEETTSKRIRRILNRQIGTHGRPRPRQSAVQSL